MRILIAAEHASAQFGGEAFLPLHYFRVLRSRHIETWLVVHSRTQPELQALFPNDCDRMFFIPDTWLHQFLYRLGKSIPGSIGAGITGSISHLYTQLLQRRIVRQLVREHQIDVVHEPIPVSPKLPSLMFNVGAPVVIGPLNGGMEFPPAFRARRSRLTDLAMALGRQSAGFFNRLLPGKTRAQTILVANQRTQQALPSGIRGTVIELVENGVDLSTWQATAPIARDPDQPARFMFLGRLVGWKAVELLLEAFQPVAAKTQATLEIVGDGEMRSQWESLSESLGLGDRVVFAGWLPQAECATRLQQSDGLVLPSLLECGGAVVLEAMSMGVPVIATQWGGPADYIDSTCGILVEPTSRDALVHGLTDAMLKLAQSPDLRQQMGLAGQERIRQQFDWERKVDRMLDIYHQTCASKAGVRCQVSGVRAEI